MTSKFNISDAIKFTTSVEGKFVIGDEGRVEFVSEPKEDGTYTYSVKSAGMLIPDVEEKQIEFVYSGIDKNVDSYLRQREESKSFKDSDVRVGGSRKEMMAFKGMIDLSDLEKIEKDSVTAKALIKKDKVYPKINTGEQIDKGVSGGTLFLKMKLRELCGNTPPETAEFRQLYVGLAQWIYEEFDSAITLFDFEASKSFLKDGIIRKSILIANPDMQEELEKQKEEYNDKLNKLEEDIKKKEAANEKLISMANAANVRSWDLTALELNFPEEFKEYKYWNNLVELSYNFRRYRILPLEYKFLHKLAVNDGNKKISLLTGKDISGGVYELSDYDYIEKYRDKVKDELIKTVFGERFFNFIKSISSTVSVANIYQEAAMYEGFSQEQYDEVNERQIKPKEARIEKYQKATDLILDPDVTIKDKIAFALGEGGMGNWGTGNKSNRYELRDMVSLELNGRRNRRYDLNRGIAFMEEIVTKGWGFPKYISDLEHEITKIKEKNKVRENNYKFLDKEEKERKKVERTSELTINSGVPLSFIERKGGVAVYDTDLDDSDKVLSFYKNVLGITGITYGISLPDNERKAHAKHFAASIIDLAETLNIDVKEMIGIGNLGIKFAASGRGKAMAHYEPDRIAINLTRSAGDGTVCHEVGHYLDGMLARKFPREGKSEEGHSVYGSFTKENAKNISNNNIMQAMENLMYFIKNGVPVDKNTLQLKNVSTESEIFKKIEPLIPEFISSVTSTVVTVRVEANTSTVNSKSDTIENTIKHYKSSFPNYFDYLYYLKNTARVNKLFGAIVNSFKLTNYNFQFTNEPKNKVHGMSGSFNTSTAFYMKNKAMKSKYWTFDWEIFTRGMETFVFDKMAKYGRSNNYLVSGAYFDRPEGVYAYGIERSILYILYDELFRVIKSEMQLSDFKPFRDERVDEYFELNDDDTEKTKLIIDDATSEIVENTTDNAEQMNEAISLAQGLIDILKGNKTSFEEGGEVNADKLVSSLFTFSKAA